MGCSSSKGTKTIQQTSENKPVEDKTASESSLVPNGQNGHIPTPPPSAPTTAWTDSETPQKASKPPSRKSSARSRRSSARSNKSLVQTVNIVNDDVVSDDVADQKPVEEVETELVAEVPGTVESAEDAKSEKSVSGEAEPEAQKPEGEAEKETVEEVEEVEEVVKPQTPDKVTEVADAVENKSDSD